MIFSFWCLVNEFDSQIATAECLYFPDLKVTGNPGPLLLKQLEALLPEVLEEYSCAQFYQLEPPEQLEELKLELEVAATTVAALGVCWRHALWHAYFPRFSLEVLAEGRAELQARCHQQLEQELYRRRLLDDPVELHLLNCPGSLKFSLESIEIEPPSLQVQLAESTGSHPESILEEMASRLEPAAMPLAYKLEEQVESLAGALETPGRGVLLCGPAGCGKTASFLELVRRSQELQLGRTRFWETSGARLLAGAEGFGMWQDRCRKMIVEAAKTRAVVHLGNLAHLVQAGRSESCPEGVAGFLRPAIARGQLTAICEATPSEWQRLEEEQPSLCEAFARVEFRRPSSEESVELLLQTAWTRSSHPELVNLAAVERLDYLFRRFAWHSPYPQLPLRFLEQLLSQNKTLELSEEVNQEFSRYSGMPLCLLSEQEAFSRDQVLEYFSARVLGQSRAVESVVDALIKVRSGLARMGRPIASLLLVGPTGVGKTEMARALAEFIFGDRRRLTRFDMSEYSDAWSLSRLVAGNEGRGRLTSAVRAHPFSVLLFDEVEKADPGFFDLLLGLLGEARLSDRHGTVDFSNTVVLMTSNLGAEGFTTTQLGFRNPERDPEQHFIDAVRSALRPELFNRLDQVIGFLPLEFETVRRVATLELDRIRRRDGLTSRRATLELEPEYLDELAHQGTVAERGARELQRVFRSKVVAELAAHLVARPQPEGHHFILGRSGLSVEKRRNRTARLGTLDALEEATEARRRLSSLLASPAQLELENEIASLKRLQDRDVGDEETVRWLRRLPRLELLHSRLLESHQQACELERDWLRTLDNPEQAPDSSRAAMLTELAQLLLTELYSLQFETPDFCLLAAFSRQNSVLQQVLELYSTLAVRFGLELDAQAVDRGHGKQRGSSFWNGREWCSQTQGKLRRYPISREQQLPREVVGLLLCFDGSHAFPLLEGEHGLHRWRLDDDEHLCWVEASERELDRYRPPEELLQQRKWSGPRGRTYTPRQSQVQEPGRDPSQGRKLDSLMVELLRRGWLERAAEVILAEH